MLSTERWGENTTGFARKTGGRSAYALDTAFLLSRGHLATDSTTGSTQHFIAGETV
jgi:hypothetical protein